VGVTVSVIVFAARDAETFTRVRSRKTGDGRADFLRPRGVGLRRIADTSSVSETLASPGMQTSSHMSHSAARVEFNFFPALESAGA